MFLRTLGVEVLTTLPTSDVSVRRSWSQLASFVAPFGFQLLPWLRSDGRPTSSTSSTSSTSPPSSAADSTHLDRVHSFVMTEESGNRSFVHCLTRFYPVPQAGVVRSVVRMQIGAFAFGRDDTLAETLLDSPLVEPLVLCVHTSVPCFATVRRALVAFAGLVSPHERFTAAHLSTLHTVLTSVKQMPCVIPVAAIRALLPATGSSVHGKPWGGTSDRTAWDSSSPTSPLQESPPPAAPPVVSFPAGALPSLVFHTHSDGAVCSCENNAETHESTADSGTAAATAAAAAATTTATTATTAATSADGEGLLTRGLSTGRGPHIDITIPCAYPHHHKWEMIVQPPPAPPSRLTLGPDGKVRPVEQVTTKFWRCKRCQRYERGARFRFWCVTCRRCDLCVEEEEDERGRVAARRDLPVASPTSGLSSSLPPSSSPSSSLTSSSSSSSSSSSWSSSLLSSSSSMTATGATASTVSSQPGACDCTTVPLFTSPCTDALPELDVDLSLLFAKLDARNIITLFMALLCEKHVRA